jgi:hypothetical protein
MVRGIGRPTGYQGDPKKEQSHSRIFLGVGRGPIFVFLGGGKLVAANLPAPDYESAPASPITRGTVKLAAQAYLCSEGSSTATILFLKWFLASK